MQSLIINFIVIIFIECSYCDETSGNDTLILVHVITREGARSPIYTYPTDPQNETSWPQGYGQLTKLGVSQQYNLGKFLRKHYIEGEPHSLMSPSYKPDEISILSADSDKLLSSSYSCMAGLYPSDELVNNLIPVHTIPLRDDKLLVNDNCPNFDKVHNEVVQSEEVETLRNHHASFFQSVVKKIHKNLNSFLDVSHLADNLLCTKLNNFTLPAWANNIYGDEDVFHILMDVRDFYTDVKYNRRNEAKLKAGVLLAHITNKMVKTSDKFPQKSKAAQLEKAFFYFTYENMLAAIMSAMGVFDGETPPFAASLMLELYHDNSSTANVDDRFYVKILYRNLSSLTTVPPYVLRLPHCDEKCPLKKFIELTKDNQVLDWKDACIEKTPAKKEYFVVVLMCVTAASVFFAMVTLFILIVKHRSGKAYKKYVDVPTEAD